MYSKNLYLIITNNSMMIYTSLAATESCCSVSSVLDSKMKNTPFIMKVLVPGGKIVLSVDNYIKCIFSDTITVIHHLLFLT